MSQRSIEEVYKSIAPPHTRGFSGTPISEGFTGGGSELGSSLSGAAQEIAQLRASWQKQADLIAANTQALQGNTSAQSHSAAGTIGHAASSLFGGALGFLSPIVSGLTHLFGGGAAQPAALPFYTAPPPISIDGTLRSVLPAAAPAASSASSSAAQQSNYSPQITVQVSAMDSQSFLDRSGDIANAVREAMLNNHPLNSVVADL